MKESRIRDELFESNEPYLFQRSNIVGSDSEHIGFGPFEGCATPEITKQ